MNKLFKTAGFTLASNLKQKKRDLTTELIYRGGC